MGGRHRNAKQLSRLHLFQMGEYGLFLAIIPGIVLSLFTGQFAFAISPITLSLWLNLFRRSCGDRSTYRLSVERHQEAVHRFESVVELAKRDRANFLVNHAGQLTPRDQPQCLQVLAFRASCVEQNRESLASYLLESSQAMAQDIATLQDQYVAQRRHVEQIRNYLDPASGIDSEFLSDVYTQFASLSARINQLNLQVAPSEHHMHELQDRVLGLQDTYAKLMQVDETLRKSKLMKAWAPLNADLQERLASVVTQYEQNCENRLQRDDPLWTQTLAVIHHSISEHLHTWENVMREQCYKLLRLQEKLQKIECSMEYLSPFEEMNSLTQRVMEQCAHLDVTESTVTRELDLVKRNLADLLLFCEANLPSDPVSSFVAQTVSQAADKIQTLSSEQPLSQANTTVLVQSSVQPLQDQLAQCDQRLTELAASASNDAIALQVATIETQLQTLSERFEKNMDIRRDCEDAELGALYTQISLIRLKLEELNHTVALEVQQVPSLVESHIRHKFSSHASSVLVANPLT